MDPNATVIERIMTYVENDQLIEAEALVVACDFLEDCFMWEVTFYAL